MFAQRVCILELILAPNAEAYMDAAVHVAGVGLRRRWSWQGLQLFVDCVACCSGASVSQLNMILDLGAADSTQIQRTRRA